MTRTRKDLKKILWKTFRKAGMSYDVAVKAATILSGSYTLDLEDFATDIPVRCFTGYTYTDFDVKSVSIEVKASLVHYPTKQELEIDDDFLQWYKIIEGTITIGGSTFRIKDDKVLFIKS